ncbi:hypothetical protein B0H10DRAFT_2328836 [Mycena sp. CBHHK59/15]|nr:hypothetical protein B0H10DRAFT_2328836 [Mycena sp. CBHHK59/15]
MSSFNPTAMRQQLSTERTIQAAAAVPNLEPPPVQLGEQPLPQPELQQTILAFTPTRHDGDYELTEMARPAKKARLDGGPKPKRTARCCALCAHANFGLEETCKGRGGREKCEHKNQLSHRELGFEQATRKRHRKRVQGRAGGAGAGAASARALATCMVAHSPTASIPPRRCTRNDGDDGEVGIQCRRGQGDPALTLALTWTGGYGHEGKGKGGGGAHHGRCSVARSCSVAAASGVHA